MKIVAVIPVREGSERVPNKNFRKFGNTNLLELKIQNMMKVNGIDEIQINTDSEFAIDLAKKYNLNYHIRDPYYASSQAIGSEVWEYLAKTNDGDAMALSHVTTPFISVESMNEMVQIYRTQPEYDSIVSVDSIKKFLWRDGKPLNYRSEQAPRTQDLDDIYALTGGLNILSNEFICENKSIVGHKPYFYQTSDFENIDIDYPLDFEIAEALYLNRQR